MINKPFIAAAAVAAMFAGFATTQAQAKKWDLDVGIYLGTPGYVSSGYGYGYFDDYDRVVRHRISCEEGRWAVRLAGYRRVRVDECDGRRYTYIARKHGEHYVIKVSAYSGDIVSVRAYDDEY